MCLGTRDPYTGHSDQDKTLNLARRFFYWSKTKHDGQEYVRTCDTYLHMRSVASLLQPFPIPKQKWQSVSVDCITNVPLTIRGHSDIVVFVDWLTKMVKLHR